MSNFINVFFIVRIMLDRFYAIICDINNMIFRNAKDKYKFKRKLK
ncbi:hypothetical protein CDLVIII_2359 [Clostridium sp. DL-VIII]|nr:hypothetical protein [Clostridium sp. DL-VIII]EHI99014.1 hypothetical protein CDLVIII_2359 [Clostridium sp. DL-VIII]